MVHNAERLKELQALDLNHKIMITQTRIIEWYEKFNGNVYISFSGGKDSTVLLHIARQLYPNIPAVFSNTGLEYYEIQKFAKQMGATFIAPKIRFDEVVSTYGYPLISKEVSEAIYYARRINSQSVQVERERERERRRPELLGARRTNFLETGRLETIGNWGGRIKTLSRQEQRRIAEQACKADGGNMPAGGTNFTENCRRTNRPTGKDEPGVVGTPTKAGSATDGSCQGSEVPPG